MTSGDYTVLIAAILLILQFQEPGAINIISVIYGFGLVFMLWEGFWIRKNTSKIKGNNLRIHLAKHSKQCNDDKCPVKKIYSNLDELQKHTNNSNND